MFRVALWVSFGSCLTFPCEAIRPPQVLSTLNTFAHLWNVPAPNLHFKGRQTELLTIQQVLEREQVLVLTGGVGMGKTQLAKAYAYQAAASYDLIIWLRVDETLPLQLQKLGKTQGARIDDLSEPSLDEILSALSSCLHEKRCLFIFDHAADLEILKPYLSLQKNPKTYLLVTSQNSLTPHRTLSVNPFSRKEAVDFLKSTCQKLSASECDQLAQALGNHPLALSLAAGFIRFTPGACAKNYLALKTGQSMVFVDQYAQDLESAIKLTLQSLSKKLPEASQVLKLLSLLDARYIPLSLMQCPDRVLRTLCESSLLDFQNNPKIPTPHLSIHPLIHKMIRQQLTGQEKRDLLGMAIPLVLPFFQGESAEIARNILKEPSLLRHAHALSDLSETIDYHSRPLLSLRIRLLHALHTGQRDLQKARALIPLIEEAQKALCRFPDLDDRILYETDQGFLAAALDVNWDTSIFHGEKALALLKQKHDAPNEKLRVLSNLLQGYTLTGQVVQAEKIQREVQLTLKVSRSLLRQAVFQIACAGLLTVQGHFAKSRQLLTETEPLIKELSYHLPTKMMFLRAKAENLVRLGHQKQGEAVLSELQENIQRFYGERPSAIQATVWVLRAFNQTSSTNNVQRAIQLYNTIWRGDTKMAPQGFAHFVLGCVFEKAGNHAQALRAYQKADAIYDTALQEKAIHDVGQLFWKIVTLACRLKKMDLARLYLKKQGHVFGLNHPRTKELMKVCDQFLRVLTYR